MNEVFPTLIAGLIGLALGVVGVLAYFFAQRRSAQLPAVVEALDSWLRMRLTYLDTQNELLTLRVQYDQELEQ